MWTANPKDAGFWASLTNGKGSVKEDLVTWAPTSVEGQEYKEKQILMAQVEAVRFVEGDPAVKKPSVVIIHEKDGNVTKISGGYYYSQKIMEVGIDHLTKELAKSDVDLENVAKEKVKKTAKDVGLAGGAIGAIGGMFGGMTAYTLAVSAIMWTEEIAGLAAIGGAVAGGATLGIIGAAAGLVVGGVVAGTQYAEAKKEQGQHLLAGSDKLYERIRCHYEAFRWCRANFQDEFKGIGGKGLLTEGEEWFLYPIAHGDMGEKLHAGKGVHCLPKSSGSMPNE